VIHFAHPAEAQLAELLDSFGVAWEYEPRTFILDFDGNGRPREGFTPDFYLPGFDLYVEITTLRQVPSRRAGPSARPPCVPRPRSALLPHRPGGGHYLHLVMSALS
jgi:hypothetical protein